MATLFNTKISATYEGLLKTINNAALSATLRELTDGSGNQSGLFLNTAGDFKVTSVLEWGSLKDTGTGVTITQFVTAANGIENFNNDTTLPTSAAVKLYVDTKFSQTDTLTEVLGFGNTTSGKDIAVSAGDDITFTDTSKILMGASSDLQIYHDGNHSYLADVGTGNLYIRGTNFNLENSSGAKTYLSAIDGEGVKINYNDILRLETTTDGSKVTGNLVVTGTITGAGGSFLPLAGGTMTGNTLHGDGVHSYWGNNNDLQIDHDGNHSVFNSLTGNVYFSNEQNDGHIELRTDNGSGGVVTYLKLNGSSGAVELNHYGAVKLATKTYGVEVTGQLISTSNIQVGNNLILGDNKKALFGSSNDLQIYHSGSDSFIHDSGSGGLRILTNEFRVYNEAQTELIINAVQNGAVELYYDNTKRLETLTDGAKVSGNLEVTGTITGAGGSFLPLIGGTMTGNTIHNDNVKSIYGTANDGLEIFHNGADSFISDTGTGDLYIRGNDNIYIQDSNTERFITCNSNASIDLFFNDAEKLRTTNTGIAVTGNIVPTGSVNIADSQFLNLGNNDDLTLTHNGTGSIIKNFTGALNIDQAAVTESIVVKVSNANALDTTALIINREGDLITGADVTIAGDLTVNGTTTTVNSQTLSVADPLISLATANSANSLDIGFYGKYNDGTARYLGLFNDASDSNKFRLFRGTTVEPTTTVNIGGTGYVAADLVVAGLESSSFVSTGTVSATSFISTTDAGIDINGIALTRVAANSAIRVSQGLETIGLLRSYAALNVGTTGTFGGNVTIGETGANPLVFSKSVYGDFDAENFYRIKFNDVGGTANDVGIGQMDASSMGFNITPSSGASFKFNAGTSGNILELNAAKNAIFAGNVALTGGSLSITADGSNAATLTESSVGIFTIAALDDIILDAAGDIALDAGGDDIRFRVNGTTYGSFNNASSNLNIYSSIQDKSIKFLGNDAGTQITALTLNMADGGDATFARGITAASNSFKCELDGSANALLDLSSTGSQQIRFFDTNSSYTEAMRLLRFDDKLVITYGDNANEEALTVVGTGSTAGYVGIGTTSPDVKLQIINSDSTQNILSLSNQNDKNLAFDFGRDVNTGALSIQGRQTGYNNILLAPTSGNVGIGTTTPQFKLGLSNAAALTAVYQHFTNGTTGIASGDGVVMGIDADGDFLINNQESKVIKLLTSDAERMRITAGGNLQMKNDTFLSWYSGAGTEVENIGIQASDANGIMKFYTEGVERQRITNTGEVKIGTTTVNSNGLTIEKTGNHLFLRASSATAGKYWNFDVNSNNALSVVDNGNTGVIINDGDTSWSSNSDISIKENIKPLNNVLDKIKDYRCVEYNLKSDENKGKKIGFIAQDWEQDFAPIVSKDDDGLLSMKYTETIPVLLKAIQELKAEIELLKAK